MSAVSSRIPVPSTSGDQPHISVPGSSKLTSKESSLSVPHAVNSRKQSGIVNSSSLLIAVVIELVSDIFVVAHNA